MVSKAEFDDLYLGLDLAQLLITETQPIPAVSKRPKEIMSAPAALFILHEEDIRRSGATSIPELLRLVPGVHVARASSSTWDVGVRGFSGQLLNRLLVLIDGRSIHDPTVSAVYWDISSPMLEDLERVEVIRGPGSVVWGINAVNGVINIITKNSKRTLGTLISLGSGNEERTLASIRHGTRLDEQSTLRVFATHNSRDALELESGESSDDSWHQQRAGVRYDRNADKSILTISSDLVWAEGRREAPALNNGTLQYDNARFDTYNYNLLARWNYQMGADHCITLQSYYDRIERDYVNTQQARDTIDFELSHSLPSLGRHEIVWGLGIRHYNDSILANPSNTFAKPHEKVTSVNVFLQDQIPVSEQIQATLGSKVTYHEFTGIVYQPGVRLHAELHQHLLVWGSATRVVRIPSRFERDGSFTVRNFPPSASARFDQGRIVGNRQVGNEKVLSYEVGVRQQIAESLFIDLATFYGRYSDLTTAEPELETTSVGEPVIAGISNGASAKATGLELSASWMPTPEWKLRASYSSLNDSFSVEPESGFVLDGSKPEHFGTLESQLSVGSDYELDSTLRFSDTLPATPGASAGSYLQLDLRLGWTPAPDWDISLAGQNLLKNNQRESVDAGLGNTLIHNQRGVYLKFTWRTP